MTESKEPKIIDREFAIQLAIRHNDLLFEDPTVIEDEFEARKESKAAYNKFMAAKCLIETNYYWSRLQHFLHLCNSITYGYVFPEITPMASIEAIGWSIVEATLLTQDLKEAVLEDNTLAYIEERIKYEQEFPFTLYPFITTLSPKNYDSSEINNWIVVGMKNMVHAIRNEFEKRKEKLTAASLDDLESKLKIFKVSLS